MRPLWLCLTVTLVACGPSNSGTGGAGGGSEAKPVAKARITAVRATYTATATAIVSPTVTDYMDNCMGEITMGNGTNTMELRESPNPIIHNTMAATVTLVSSPCGGRHVYSSGTDTCTFGGAGPTEYNAFQIYARAPSWNDTTQVELEMLHLAGVLGGCNYASFGGQWDAPFKITEPLSKFRGSAPFDLKYSGTATMTAQTGYTARFTYDATITVTPMN